MEKIIKSFGLTDKFLKSLKAGSIVLPAFSIRMYTRSKQKPN